MSTRSFGLVLLLVALSSYGMQPYSSHPINIELIEPIIDNENGFARFNVGIQGIEITLGDTNYRPYRQFRFDPTADDSGDGRLYVIPIGDGWHDLIVHRMLPGHGYADPYLYRWHVGDTGFVPEQMRELNLSSEYLGVRDAKLLPNGDYMVLLYDIRDNRELWYAGRITSEGEMIWILFLSARGDQDRPRLFRGIFPSKVNTNQFFYLAEGLDTIQIRGQRIYYFSANTYLVNTEGELVSYKNLVWNNDFLINYIYEMCPLNNGGSAIIGTRPGRLQVLMTDSRGDSIATYFYRRPHILSNHTRSILLDEDRILIHHVYEDSIGPWYDRRLQAFSALLLIDTNGDSLDSYVFPIDTVASYTGRNPIFRHQNGKVSVWHDAPLYLFGRRYWSVIHTFYPDGVPDAVPDDGDIGIPPYAMHLSAFPNPFNATLQLHYTLPRPGWWALRLYDTRGAEVQLLKEGWMPFGPHQL
ncbi:MAG: hypothetical protein FJY67_10020, partial [Calditrichaeota bacterium]|nr:hypothetical protein [Calditrichota bacterium]